MSKTDKTAPYDVKVHYHPLYLEEQHDHRSGVCDLPERPKVGEVTEWNGKGACIWYPSFYFWCSKDARCSCQMCSYDAYESIPRRKRQRIEGRRYCKDGWRDEY